jgi:4-hydroxy-tetrahydrodipicolinate reductase
MVTAERPPPPLLPSSVHDANSLDRKFFKFGIPSMMMMSRNAACRTLVHGARGRMGARIIDLAQHDGRFTIVAAIDQDNRDASTSISAGAIDVIIDFSSDSGAQSAIELALQQRCALLIGTTGLSRATRDAIEACAKSIAVMSAANTSLGVAVLSHLASEAARMLGSGFDIDIIESHHTAKKDAPSGTALRIADAIRQVPHANLPPERIHAIRAGDIVGEHAIQFAGPGERIILSHSATSRDLFARGALRAAHWLAQQKPGLYTIEHSLR